MKTTITLEEKYLRITLENIEETTKSNDLGFYIPPEKIKKSEMPEFLTGYDSFGKKIIFRAEFLERVVCDGMDFYFIPRTAIIGAVTYAE